MDENPPVQTGWGSATGGRRKEQSERAHPTPSFMDDMNENRYHKENEDFKVERVNCGGMAERLKAAVLKTASREPGRGFGDRREAEGAKRASTSYSLVHV